MENKKTTSLLLGVAVVASLVLGVLGFDRDDNGSQPTDPNSNQEQSAGGSVQRGAPSFPDGAQLGDSNANQIEFWVRRTMEVGSDQAVWQNTTGRKVRVYYGEIGLESGTASSTFKVSLIGTTTNSVSDSHDFVAIDATLSNTMFDSISYATSTTATTTASTYGSTVVNSPFIELADLEYLILYMQAGDDPTCQGNALALCEAASSTNRGMDPFFKVKVHYTRAR